MGKKTRAANAACRKDQVNSTRTREYRIPFPQNQKQYLQILFILLTLKISFSFTAFNNENPANTRRQRHGKAGILRSSLHPPPREYAVPRPHSGSG